MTRVFCTSTTTATDGSTRDSSSTASTDRKNGAPAPPSDSGISMPITPRSNSLSMSARGMTACSSISRARGGDLRLGERADAGAEQVLLLGEPGQGSGSGG